MPLSLGTCLVLLLVEPTKEKAAAVALSLSRDPETLGTSLGPGSWEGVVMG